MALVSKPQKSKLKSMLKRQKPRKLGKKYGCVNQRHGESRQACRRRWWHLITCKKNKKIDFSKSCGARVACVKKSSSDLELDFTRAPSILSGSMAFLLLPAASALHAFGLGAPSIVHHLATCRQRSASPLAVDSWYDAGFRLESDLAPERLQSIWDTAASTACQGNTLKTWKIVSTDMDQVELAMRSEERSPIDADVELWHTPSFKPIQFHVYSECGLTRPVNVVLDAPEHPKTVAVYNQGPLEFPFEAAVAKPDRGIMDGPLAQAVPERVQGGRITSYTFGGNVGSVQVLLKAEQNNMNAKIEITQGPNQVKQSIEVYAFAANKYPFYVVLQTPGFTETSLRIINQDTVEYPFDAWVVPDESGPAVDTGGPVMGGFMAY